MRDFFVILFHPFTAICIGIVGLTLSSFIEKKSTKNRFYNFVMWVSLVLMLYFFLCFYMLLYNYLGLIMIVAGLILSFYLFSESTALGLIVISITILGAVLHKLLSINNIVF